ncbi:MAG: glycosyltransferase family 39 protein [Elusimicrobia bacterium]|nr:glycosyltransferase family 39 protein [Elusimicrobiota bacterium]
MDFSAFNPLSLILYPSRKIQLNFPGWRRASAVFLAAFALRAVFLAQWADLPYIDSLAADAWACDRWALDILDGRLIRHTAFYQSPFYPYFLAAFYKLFGHQPQGVLWLQAFIDSLSCVAIMRIAKLCFGARAGLAAGLLAAFYRPFIFNTALLTKETFVLFALALFLIALLRADAAGLFRRHFLCGLAAGWCLLLRPNALLLVPAALLWLWLRAGSARPPGTVRGFLKGTAFPLLLGTLLPVLPATLHNFAASRDLVLLNYTSGFAFFIGNNPEATGLVTYPSGVSSDPLLEESQSLRLAEKSSGRALKPSEVSSFWFRKGLAFISAEPCAWLTLTCLKFWFFWNWHEISDNYDLHFIQKHFNTALKLPLASFALAGCLGAVGLFLCRLREPSGAPLFLFLAYLLSVLPFWISDRYRLPALVFLLPLAAAALERLAAAAARLELKNIWKPCLAASPLVFLCLAPPPFSLKLSEAAAWGQLTSIYSELGEHGKALEAFRSAVEAAPQNVGAPVISDAAFSMRRLGRVNDALELYKLGSDIYPGDAALYNNRGKLLFELGKTKEAAALLEKAAATDPDPGKEYRNLFYAYRKLGRKAQAVRYGGLAAARFPDDKKLKAELQALKNK